MRKVICLVAASDYATRPSQPDHLSDDYVAAGHIHEHEPRMNQVKASCPDSAAPSRAAQIGTFSPVLHHDGSNLAAALHTLEIRPDEVLAMTIEDAFPGSRLSVEPHNGRFELLLQQHGLLRTLSAAELSDGTLRYLLWAAALLTPRPPELMVLNEPKTACIRIYFRRSQG